MDIYRYSERTPPRLACLLRIKPIAEEIWFVEIGWLCSIIVVSEPTPTPAKPRDFWHFIRSMRHSLAGFAEAFRHEQSFREDLVFVILLTPFAIILPVKAVATAIMLASLLLIVITELLNSAIESTIDDISLARRPLA